MRNLLIVVTLLLAETGYAWQFEKNPDRIPSVGVELSQGKLAGMLKDKPADDPHTDGGFVMGHLDLRLPVASFLTLNLTGEATGVNNNMQFSEGHRLGVGFRVYLQ